MILEPDHAPRVVGLDLSWTGTGMADNQGHAETFGTKSDHPGGKRARLEATVQAVEGFVLWSHPPPALAVVEAPAFSAKGSAVVDMGGLWWHVTQRLWLSDVRVVPCSIGTLKMFATGKGSGPKPPVVAAVARREPDLPIRDDNVPDACVLRALGAAVLGYELPGWGNMPATHARAVRMLAKALEETPARHA